MLYLHDYWNPRFTNFAILLYGYHIPQLKNIAIFAIAFSLHNLKAPRTLIVHLGLKPPQKHQPLFFAKSLLKSANCPSHLFKKFSPIYWFFMHSLKIKSHNIEFSSLTPCHFLKVTKFLVKVLQFKFLVMTEKKNFICKCFCN